MASWRRICCAVDLSEASRPAMIAAAELTRALEGELTLLHVYEPPAPPSMEVPPELLDDEPPEVDERMAEWRTEALRRSERPVHSTVLSGAAAQEIARYARDREFDVVIVGTHGRTAMARVVLGSVAEKVVREAGRPVVVVPSRRAA